jgi:hypothetical protein
MNLKSGSRRLMGAAKIRHLLFEHAECRSMTVGEIFDLYNRTYLPGEIASDLMICCILPTVCSCSHRYMPSFRNRKFEIK